ncbi:MAG: 2'-5' RNA ligase [Candidatus Cloacimonas sp. 4484_275]|nr:MAG: 2'-5' RNA ligase [Candidatus Cloacimonas sp. 4484_275]RLC49210.1 MAG: RNA 2',3'-cyclic phosphodiesterase [Candidatus Cloacimonadota bacterium]
MQTLIRTFLALEIPAFIRRELSQTIREFQAEVPRGIKWVKDENLHITLQFVGDTKEEDIPEIIDFLDNIFLELPELEFFKPEIQIIPGRNPRLIWVNAKTENKEIFKAVTRIKNKLQHLDYELDKKPLKFHVTLGRIKKRLPDFFIAKALSKKINYEKFKVSEATFYRSILQPEGPIYEKIKVFRLGQKDKKIENL